MLLPDIESLRCFVEAAATLNFRAASRAVGLTPAALGQRIKLLEAQLGVDLFVRTTRKVELTEAGLAMLPRARAVIDEAAQCVRAARGELGPPPMELLIGTRHELGLSWLLPMLGGLSAEFSHVRFHMWFGAGEELNLRILRRGIDCGISSRREVEPGIDYVQLHQEDYVFVGAASLLARHPVESIDDLGHHQLIDTDPRLPLFHYLRQTADSVDPGSFAGFRWMGTISAIRAAVIAEQGLAVLPTYLIAPDLEDGSLLTIWPERRLEHDWFRLLFRADDPRAPFFRALGKAMLAHPLR